METVRDKRVAVIGDSDLLCKAIKLALHKRLHLQMADMERCGVVRSPGETIPNWDLVIVAIASEHGEPLAELAGACLIECIGKVPLLIVSSRPFESSAEFEISHVRFPFDPDQLCHRVQTLLMAPATAGRA